jgi:acyl carrier protein
MTSAEIQKTIIETLIELQAGSGEAGQEITPATLPLTDLGFFDSLLGIETTLALEELLKCKCEVDSVFKDKDTGDPLNIAQIAERLAKVAGKAA